MLHHINSYLVIIAVMVSLLAQASVIFAAPPALTNTSLAQPNPDLVQMGITQLGVADEDTYVFCHRQACPPLTIKHMPLAEVVKRPPLIMPQPVEEKLPELAESVPLKLTVKNKKPSIQKYPIQKNEITCSQQREVYR